MAHPKAVPLVLGGMTRYLVYDLSALCALRDEGIEYDKLQDADFTDPRLTRKLLWAALQAEHPDVTLLQAGAWVDLENIGAVMQATTKAFLRSSGQELAGDLDPPMPRTTAGTGETSSEAATAS